MNQELKRVGLPAYIDLQRLLFLSHFETALARGLSRKAGTTEPMRELLAHLPRFTEFMPHPTGIVTERLVILTHCLTLTFRRVSQQDERSMHELEMMVRQAIVDHVVLAQKWGVNPSVRRLGWNVVSRHAAFQSGAHEFELSLAIAYNDNVFMGHTDPKTMFDSFNLFCGWEDDPHNRCKPLVDAIEWAIERPERFIIPGMTGQQFIAWLKGDFTFRSMAIEAALT